jgi:hypothetical protein
MARRHIRVVNMIPRSMSGETNQDSEPQLTVDPERRRTIVGTAFTPDPGGGPQGPVFASVDGGETWTLDLVIPGGEPNDQSVRFGGGSALYAGILRGDVFLRLNILRSAPYSPSTVMQTLVQRDSVDQPYVAATVAKGRDKVYVGNNDSKGGSVDHSADARTAPPPAGFSQTLIDPRLSIRDSPSIRPAPHRDGTVYAAYFSWRQTSPKVLADVVVARDDNFGTGANPFTALADSGDGLAGQRVALSVPIPWFFYTANERLGSALSIAVDPTNSRIVYLAWGDGSYPGSQQTLHVRRSRDRGQTWSGDLVAVANATNPALAITADRKVGFFYQQATGSGATQRWETHVQVTRNAWKTPARDILLASTPVDNATYQYDPYIGDYADLQAVGRDFYGIFSAHNRPDHANFPHGVRYQRNANFVTKQLLNVNGVTPVAASIDPFFFHIFWREGREEEEREAFGRERLRIRGLEYERLKIHELDFEADGDSDDGDEDDRGRGVSRLIRRLADRIEDLDRREREEEKEEKEEKDAKEGDEDDGDED